MSAPANKKNMIVRNVVSMLTHWVIFLGTALRGYPIVRFLALCPDDAKQDPVVYGAEFGVVFLAKGPHTAPI